MDDPEFKWDAHRKNCPWKEANRCKAFSASASGECCEKDCAPFFWAKKIIDHFYGMLDEAKKQAEAEIEAMKNIDRGFL